MTAMSLPRPRTLRSLLRWRSRRQRTAAYAIGAADGSGVGEQYRLLALNVMARVRDAERKTVAVFSADPRISSSLVSLNLGMALAYHAEVLLLSPGIAEQDVTNVISGPDRPAHRISGLLVSGRQIPARMGELSHQPERFVLVDGPPADASSDAYFVAQEAKNVVYLLPGDATDLDVHQRNIRQLQRLEANVLGIVICGR